MSNKRFATGQTMGQWKLIEKIGEGGNGEVWSTHKLDNIENKNYAIKLLKKIKLKSYLRFRDEINVLLKLKDIEGVLPIIEHHLPDKYEENDLPWYVMPIAVRIKSYLKDKTSENIVEALISITKTLNDLHDRNIFHRDIKPDNLFFLDGKYVLGDFGLVDFPEKNHVTQRGEEIGPKWTIAPEMRRNPENAQGGPADIYSLAKTLWILLKRKYKGFDGQYNKTSIDSLGTNVLGFYASRIGDLIHNCTDNDPEKRLSTEDFTKELEKSLKEHKDYEAKTKKQWKDLILSIFPKRRISRAFWEGEEILEILGNISAEKELTHILFPDGGGLDLLGVKKSSERGCIELHTAPQGIYIIKPKKLIFESFSADFQFDYFRLETEPLKSSGLYEMGREAYSEALTELRPGEYTLYECWIHNDFNAKDLPKEARPIVRWLQGDLLIVRNTSDYLKISDFYGGIHAKMNTNEFRMFILRSLLKSSKLQNEKVKENDKKIKFARPRKFKSPSRRLIDKEFKLINKIVELAKNRKLEAEILEKKYEIKRFVLYPRNKKEEEYLSAERPEKNKLKNFLIKLTQRDLTLITAVMYGGREFRHPFSPAPLDELINDLCDNEHLVEKLMEKAPLDKYLEKGLEAYS